MTKTCLVSLLVLCVAFAGISCDGDGSGGGGAGSGRSTAKLSFEDFKKKLESAMVPYNGGKCTKCNGEGYVYSLYDGPTIRRAEKPDKPNDQIPDEGTQKMGEVCKTKCDVCNGTGTDKGRRWPSVEEFLEVMGHPMKKQEIRGRQMWYWDCADGMVQLPVFTHDPKRITWGDPNLY